MYTFVLIVGCNQQGWEVKNVYILKGGINKKGTLEKWDYSKRGGGGGVLISTCY